MGKDGKGMLLLSIVDIPSNQPAETIYQIFRKSCVSIGKKYTGVFLGFETSSGLMEPMQSTARADLSEREETWRLRFLHFSKHLSSQEQHLSITIFHNLSIYIFQTSMKIPS